MPSITKPLVIRKSNALIEASYKLTMSEQRLLVLLASTISPNDEDFKDYEITVSDFAQMFELELNKSLYDTLQNAALSLMKQQLRFNDDSVIKVVQWLSYIEYVKGSGVVKLRFDKALMPHLLQLKERFTQYRLDNIVRLSGQYSARLYELLKAESFKAKSGKFQRSFKIDELRVILGIEENAYPIFNDLKLRVINPSINEISVSSDLIVNDVKYGKTGRKITNVTFLVEVHSKDETHLRQTNLQTEDAKPEKESDNHAIIDSLVNLGFSLEMAKKYKSKHGVKKIERNIAYTLAKKQEGVAKDVPSYLNKAIENDYGGAWETENQKKVVVKKQQNTLEHEKKIESEKATQDKKARYQKAFNDFLLLPDHQQEELKQAFFEQSDLTISTKIKDAKRKGIDIFTSPLVISPFKVFLVEQKRF